MKHALALLFALVSSLSLSAQVFITNFGSDDFTDYSNPLLTAQTASTGEFDTEDVSSASIIGGFDPVDITGYTDALALTATVSVNPGTAFTLTLYDDTDTDTYTYDGTWFDFTTGVESTAILTAEPDQGAFDFTQVQGLTISFDGGLGGAINVTLSTLSAVSAIPEPATFAALAGLVGLGVVLLRRRRR